ncbi:MAG: hypothetical protein JNL18_05785 [Planctomycetaceae bacterium]|nr:hypothetical protein [Planctomycetaceae bacterium]
MKRPHLISVDEMRAAGALDVPPAWRKSLGSQVKRDLFFAVVASVARATSGAISMCAASG